MKARKPARKTVQDLPDQATIDLIVDLKNRRETIGRIASRLGIDPGLVGRVLFIERRRRVAEREAVAAERKAISDAKQRDRETCHDRIAAGASLDEAIKGLGVSKSAARRIRADLALALAEAPPAVAPMRQTKIYGQRGMAKLVNGQWRVWIGSALAGDYSTEVAARYAIGAKPKE